jgi:hypothetical protein
MMAHRCRTQRLGSLRTDHFDDLHHAQILMIQDMAAHHECADIVLVWRVDVELLPRRNQHGILPHRLRGTTRPLAFHLKRIDVDVEDVRERRNAVIFRRIANGAQRPLLDRVQHDLARVVGVEGLIVDLKIVALAGKVLPFKALVSSTPNRTAQEAAMARPSVARAIADEMKLLGAASAANGTV